MSATDLCLGDFR